MLFSITCRDKPDHLPLRAKMRDEHIAYIKGFAAALVVAGPLLDAAGQPCGATLLVNLPDRVAAEEFAAGDPFARAGLFAETAIHGFRMVFKDGAAV
jgi:uncharacterized protein YciI